MFFGASIRLWESALQQNDVRLSFWVPTLFVGAKNPLQEWILRSVQNDKKARYSFFIVNSLKYSGDYSEGVTPDPIPNSAVKPFSADGTTRATVWESRSLPDLLWSPSWRNLGRVFLWCGCHAMVGEIVRVDPALQHSHRSSESTDVNCCLASLDSLQNISDYPIATDKVKVIHRRIVIDFANTFLQHLLRPIQSNFDVCLAYP